MAVASQVESAAKKSSEVGAKIIGHSASGGLRIIKDKIYALKHPIHRFTEDPLKPWGHDNDGYTHSDLVPVLMNLDSLPTTETERVVGEWLTQMEQGHMPERATSGIEIEGAVYRTGSADLAPAYKEPGENAHPELMESTLETATGTDETGTYPHQPVSIARQISMAVLMGNEHAEQDGNRVVYSSVPEGGNIMKNKNTPIPYLNAFAPRVLAETIAREGDIPQEVKNYYAKIGIPDVISYLKKSGILNWPVNALHVHNGVPMIGEYADTRSAFAMAQIRNTDMAKVLSFMLYNTSYCYGTDVGTKDGRSIMRRLLSTAHGGNIPQSAEEYVRTAVDALEKGDIHSLARHPKHSQHDRIRIRMDGVTMESIDGAMNPDLRLVLGWTFINQIMNVIALDALREVCGDESKVSNHLQSSIGSMMRSIPAMGGESSFAHDLVFNKEGFEGKAKWMEKTYAQSVIDITKLFSHYAKKYPAIKTYVDIANHVLAQVSQKNNGARLEEYFGIEKGTYQTNGKNIGIVTDAKAGLSVKQLIDIQSKATKLQAEALSQVHDDASLKVFFGLSV